MSPTDPVRYYEKYAPSAMALFKNAALAILVSFALGWVYSMYFMDVPVDLAKEKEAAFRQGIGVGIGLMCLSPLFVFILIVKYVFDLFRAKKLAMEDYTKELSEKYKE
ncbi:hypothetical protein [Pseudomonas fluorescens]|uniref:hypothetical protein n=1 Tax=Pseudomonas fluorescens TaxID=294 RepID=UPI000AD810B2|nr:hypothetical protein [Pseudomonas fluorescens]